MKLNVFLLANLLCASLPAMSMENVIDITEVYTAKKCAESRDMAFERAAAQINSGSDIYNGDATAFKGRKIIRFVHNSVNCEAVYSGSEGMLFNYYLHIQLDAGK